MSGLNTSTTPSLKPIQPQLEDRDTYRSEVLSNIEPRMLRIESGIPKLQAELSELREDLKAFQAKSEDSLGKMLELVELIVMGNTQKGTKKKKLETNAAYIKAQCGSVGAMLTPDILGKVGSFVLSKYIVDSISKKAYVLQTVNLPFEMLNFAPHPKSQKQAANTDMGRLFYTMKMRLVWTYVVNCVERAKLKERENAFGNAERTRADCVDGSISISFRPLWARDGVISRKIVDKECERISGCSMNRKRKVAVIVEESGDEDEGANSRASRRDRDSSRSSYKRQRLQCEPGVQSDAVAKAVVRTLWGEATDWLNQSRHQGRRASTRGLGFFVTPKAKAVWDVKCECRIVDLALFASRSVVAQRPLLGPALLVAPFGSSS